MLFSIFLFPNLLISIFLPFILTINLGEVHGIVYCCQLRLVKKWTFDSVTTYIPPPDHTFLEATWRLFAPDDPGRNPKGALAKIGPVIIHGNQQGLVARLPTTLWDSDHLPDGT